MTNEEKNSKKFAGLAKVMISFISAQMLLKEFSHAQDITDGLDISKEIADFKVAINKLRDKITVYVEKLKDEKDNKPFDFRQN